MAGAASFKAKKCMPLVFSLLYRIVQSSCCLNPYCKIVLLKYVILVFSILILAWSWFSNKATRWVIVNFVTCSW